MATCRQKQAWCSSRGLEKWDAGCSVEEQRHGLVRE